MADTSSRRFHVYLPYKTAQQTIYGKAKLCVELEEKNDDDDDDPSSGNVDCPRFRVMQPPRRVCVKISDLNMLRLRLKSEAGGGIGRRPENPLNELRIMAMLQGWFGDRSYHHLNLSRLERCGYDGRYLFAVYGFLDGGDLQEEIAAMPGRSIPEHLSRAYYLDLLRGLAFMHIQHGIAHLDISLENAMLRTETADDVADVPPSTAPRLRAVLIDFGMSRHIPRPQDSTVGLYGKFQYMHPSIYHTYRLCKEAAKNKQPMPSADTFPRWSMVRADLWSLAVCLFSLLVGGPPWEIPCPHADARFRKIVVEGELDSLLKRWGVRRHLSDDAVDFLQRCFTLTGDRALGTIQEIVCHPWMRQAGSVIVAPIYDDDDDVVSSSSKVADDDEMDTT